MWCGSGCVLPQPLCWDWCPSLFDQLDRSHLFVTCFRKTRTSHTTHQKTKQWRPGSVWIVFLTYCLLLLARTASKSDLYGLSYGRLNEGSNTQTHQQKRSHQHGDRKTKTQQTPRRRSGWELSTKWAQMSAKWAQNECQVRKWYI